MTYYAYNEVTQLYWNGNAFEGDRHDAVLLDKHEIDELAKSYCNMGFMLNA